MRIFSQRASTRNADQSILDGTSSNIPRLLLHSPTNLTVITCLLLLAAISYTALETQASKTIGQPAAVTNQLPRNAVNSVQKLSIGSARAVTVAAPINNSHLGDSSSTVRTTSQSDSSFQVSVNGQDIAVPENGSVNKSVPTVDGSGQTDISVTNVHSSDGNSYTQSFSSTNSGLSSSTTMDVSSENSSP